LPNGDVAIPRFCRRFGRWNQRADPLGIVKQIGRLSLHLKRNAIEQRQLAALMSVEIAGFYFSYIAGSDDVAT